MANFDINNTGSFVIGTAASDTFNVNIGVVHDTGTGGRRHIQRLQRWAS